MILIANNSKLLHFFKILYLEKIDNLTLYLVDKI